VTRHGKFMKQPRGLHKKDVSPEVVRWNEALYQANEMPERPSWMSWETYQRLARERLRSWSP